MKRGARRWALSVLCALAAATAGIPPATAQAAPGTVVPAATSHIINLNSGQCAAVPGGSLDAGKGLIQWPCGGWADHYWNVVGVGGGWYRVANVNSGQCMAVNGGSHDWGAPVIQWPCGSWLDHFWGLRDMGGGLFQLYNRNSGQCLAVPGGSLDAGASLIQWPCGGWRDHYWRLG